MAKLDLLTQHLGLKQSTPVTLDIDQWAILLESVCQMEIGQVQYQLVKVY